MVSSNAVSYKLTTDVWDNYSPNLHRLLVDLDVHKLCEVGGGCNPAVGVDFINQHNIKYTLLDISPEELAKAPEGYSKVIADVCERQSLPAEKYDFIFTKMLAEHVSDGKKFHENVFQLLEPGGYAFHFFPTLFALPFAVNRVIPERLSERILEKIAPRDKVYLRKFPAYYSWCYGPTKKQISRFHDIGYEIITYDGLFGAEGYYRRLPFGVQVSKAVAKFLIRNPIPQLTAFSLILLRKPSNG